MRGIILDQLFVLSSQFPVLSSQFLQPASHQKFGTMNEAKELLFAAVKS
jgi:hypothetical protein